MAGTAFRLELEGSAAALAALAEAESRLTRPEPLYDAIGAMLVTSTQQRFEAEAGPDGSPWPKSIRVLLEGGKTLTDSGFLRNSISFEASDHGVAVGTNAIYAAVQQFGATIRPVSATRLRFELGGETIFSQEVTIPARPFLGLDAGDEQGIIAIAGKFVLAPFGDAPAEGGAHAR